MRIAIFGATGRTGRFVVEHALGHGHDVRAVQHVRPIELTHPRLEVVKGDVRAFDDVLAAVQGCDAVIMAVGSGSGHLYEQAAAALVHAMAIAEVPRLAAMSAAGTFARADRGLSLGFRALIATSLKATYSDLEAMEQRIMASGLEWTIVRPAGLSDAPPTGDYRVSRDGRIPPKIERITRSDVAAILLKSVETDSFVKRALVVSG